MNEIQTFLHFIAGFLALYLVLDELEFEECSIIGENKSIQNTLITISYFSIVIGILAYEEMNKILKVITKIVFLSLMTFHLKAMISYRDNNYVC